MSSGGKPRVVASKEAFRIVSGLSTRGHVRSPAAHDAIEAEQKQSA
jgi:hypothetical protein